MKNFLILVILFISIDSYSQEYSIVPYPNVLIPAEGELQIKGTLSINQVAEFTSEVALFKNVLKNDFFINLVNNPKPQLTLKKVSTLPKEAYNLTISPSQIVLEASSTTGCFYGFQSLRQLLKLNGKGYYTIGACKIEDKPEYGWRSHLLDDGRFFMGKEYVKKTLDNMALLKMNVFQWHLTEDQGWRIEIKKYPKLTELGAWRDSTLLRAVRWQPERNKWGWFNTKYDGTPHGGYYTQDDIKEVVEYARQRHITIVPEIEMPGHSSAAAYAYPWLASGTIPNKVPNEFGIKENAFNVADPKVYQFIEDVLTEVMQLFPSKVIHIGGDEVKFSAWKSNPVVQAMMEKEGLKSYADLQIHFTNKISKFLESKGREMMGWNEILGSEHQDKEANEAVGTLAKNTIVQYWKGSDSLYQAMLEKGYRTVYSENKNTYLCFPKEWLGIDVIYKTSLIPANVTPAQRKLIIGVNSSMWTEIMQNFADCDKLTYPRLAAISELGWTKAENKDFNRFKTCLAPLKKYWDYKGVILGEE
jgi:hexosaminidase